MSFIASSTGTTFNAGHFLIDDELSLRESATIAANHAQKVTRNGRIIVPAGAVIPANGATAVGILYEDIDVTDGAAHGSIVTKGKIYEDRLPATPVSDAKTALKGLAFVTSPSVYRPAIFEQNGLVALTVTAADSATASSTDITVSGYTMQTGDAYLYKTHATAAPTVTLGQQLAAGTDSWASWDGDDPIAATNGHKITIAVINGLGQVVAAGSTTAVVA